jgi:hypothetical protein
VILPMPMQVEHKLPTCTVPPCRVGIMPWLLASGSGLLDCALSRLFFFLQRMAQHAARLGTLDVLAVHLQGTHAAALR